MSQQVVDKIANIFAEDHCLVKDILYLASWLGASVALTESITREQKQSVISYPVAFKQLLLEWQKREGSKATVRRLSLILKEMGYLNLKEVIEDIFDGSENILDKVAQKKEAREEDFLSDVEPLVVKVEPGKSFKGSNDKDNHHYSLRSNPRGSVLIINNLNYDERTGLQNRKEGGEIDEKYMKKLFKGMGFKSPMIVNDIADREELDLQLRKFKKTLTPQTECCIIVIMGHGGFNRLNLCDPGEEVNLLQKIVYQFDHNNCHDLKGKPKIFITQLCQDFGDDGSLTEKVEVELEDAIICYPAMPGDKSRRDGYKGSYFIHNLTKIMMENAGKIHFKEMLEMVRNTVTINEHRVNQKSWWMNFEFGELYFNPCVKQ